MTNLIDKRAVKLDVAFRDLKLGDFFQDASDCIIGMKIGAFTAMFYDGGEWSPLHIPDDDWLIIPLKATITIEREDKGE